MKIKCGREEFDLTAQDEILFNGACYQIITRRTGIGLNSYIPKIAKTTASKMIKNGELVFCRKYIKDSECDIYKIKE
jgi:hypothetical protein